MSDMNDRFLKTGIFLAPFHPLHENPLLAIDRDMELLEHLDRLNYTEAWVGEHHSAGFEIINCPRCSSPPPPSARAISASAPASSRCPTTTPSPSPAA
jgi:alkanesulfonate monooxygenase SsuD/methylene tetrahydromethanopterin reductase-like flavin-dependent oxidoreductase (luciferase family)